MDQNSIYDIVLIILSIFIILTLISIAKQYKKNQNNKY